MNDSTTISQNIPDVNLRKEEDLNGFVVGIPKVCVVKCFIFVVVL